MHPPALHAPRFHTFFVLGMWWRIIYGILRVVLGLALLRVIGAQFGDLFYDLMRHEIMEVPRDFLLHTIGAFLSHHSFTVTYFLALYLIFWGVIDAVLSVCLLYEKLWAFPVSIALIAVFMCYEVYRVLHTHSLILAGIICMDVVLLWVIREEYRRRIVLVASRDTGDTIGI